MAFVATQGATVVDQTTLMKKYLQFVAALTDVNTRKLILFVIKNCINASIHLSSNAVSLSLPCGEAKWWALLAGAPWRPVCVCALACMCLSLSVHAHVCPGVWMCVTGCRELVMCLLLDHDSQTDKIWLLLLLNPGILGASLM